MRSCLLSLRCPTQHRPLVRLIQSVDIPIIRSGLTYANVVRKMTQNSLLASITPSSTPVKFLVSLPTYKAFA